MTARDSAARDVISHKREEKHAKKSVGHTKWHTKSVENTVQKAENIAARSHGRGAAALTCERYCGAVTRSRCGGAEKIEADDRTIPS